MLARQMVPRTGKVLEIPFSQMAAFILGAMGASAGCSALMSVGKNVPYTMKSEFVAEARPIGSIAVRACVCRARARARPGSTGRQRRKSGPPRWPAGALQLLSSGRVHLSVSGAEHRTEVPCHVPPQPGDGLGSPLGRPVVDRRFDGGAKPRPGAAQAAAPTSRARLCALTLGHKLGARTPPRAPRPRCSLRPRPVTSFRRSAPAHARAPMAAARLTPLRAACMRWLTAPRRAPFAAAGGGVGSGRAAATVSRRAAVYSSAADGLRRAPQLQDMRIERLRPDPLPEQPPGASDAAAFSAPPPSEWRQHPLLMSGRVRLSRSPGAL